jgi:hypothetical protein
MTKQMRRLLPPLVEARRQDADPWVRLRYYNPYQDQAFYLMEFDGAETYFGYGVEGDYGWLGYFILYEETAKRDPNFKPCRLSELRARLGKRELEKVEPEELLFI